MLQQLVVADWCAVESVTDIAGLIHDVILAFVLDEKLEIKTGPNCGTATANRIS